MVRSIQWSNIQSCRHLHFGSCGFKMEVFGFTHRPGGISKKWRKLAQFVGSGSNYIVLKPLGRTQWWFLITISAKNKEHWVSLAVGAGIARWTNHGGTKLFGSFIHIFVFKHTYGMFKVFVYIFFIYMVTNKYYLITIRAGL